MPGCFSTISCPSLIRRLAGGRREPSLEPSQSIGINRTIRHPLIHILNDDVLLNIFHLYRLAEPDEYEVEKGLLRREWPRQRWWYKLAHVCRLWRNLILESPSRLALHLYCTNGVPVADMLAHSPPLPLTIHYHSTDLRQTITEEDESGILLALSHRDRVRRIYFCFLPHVENFVTVMEDQFPVLECMFIDSWTKVDLPVTFQAPNLRHLRLWKACIPIGSSLLTISAAGLVTLSLHDIPASAYFSPSRILAQLSLMAQLERLSIGFKSPIPNGDVERELHQTPDMTTLPNLYQLFFQGTATYLECLVARISAPSLNRVHVYLYNQLPFTFPGLLQFMKTSENLTFTSSTVQVTFSALAVSLHAVPWRLDTPFVFQIGCSQLDSQVASAVQLFRTLSPILSAVEQVAFSYEEHHQSSDNNVDRSQWRELLRPFANAKTIHLQDDLVSKVFHSLPSKDGEPPLELLPNLEEIAYSGECDAWDALRFLNERQVAGQPVSLRVVDRWMFNKPWHL